MGIWGLLFAKWLKFGDCFLLNGEKDKKGSEEEVICIYMNIICIFVKCICIFIELKCKHA